MGERIYMVGAEDENGDEHIFVTGNLLRAIAAYEDMQARYGQAKANDGLADAMRMLQARESAIGS